MPVSIDIDINVDIPRGKSKFPISNRTRKSSILSNISPIPYHERMKIQSNNSFQSEQVEAEKTALLYVMNSKKDDVQAKQQIDNSPNTELLHVNNETLALNNMPLPQGESEAINTSNTWS